MTYKPTFLPDGRKAYDPQRTYQNIHEEWDAFEAEVLAENPDCRFPGIEARERWRKQEETAERWSEWQQRVWFPRMRAEAAARPSNELTVEEWAYLAEFLAGANHPLAKSIGEKASRREGLGQK